MTPRAPLAALLIALLAAPGLAGRAAAEPIRAVVELFTSQGCSSCPPADRALLDLAREPGLVALTLPVDYWDYLGWSDTLADPAFSARQRAYAAMRNDRQVYTPQMVVNGKAKTVGSDRSKIDAHLSGAKPGLPVAVAVSEADGRVVVEVGESGGSEARGEARGEVWLLPVLRRREVAIGRGENRGRTATYANVVRGLTWVGSWRAGQPARFEVPLAAARAADADAYVVLLQAGEPGRPGPILGAAKGAGL